MRAPRWFRRRWAWAGGYFWRACPVCSEEFGGQEWRDRDGHVSTIPKDAGLTLLTGVLTGIAICPTCTRQGVGDATWADVGVTWTPETVLRKSFGLRSPGAHRPA